MQKNKFDEILKSRLGAFEKTPPPGMFDKIKSRIETKEDEKKLAFIFPVFLKYGAAASIAFLFGLFAMNAYLTNDSSKSALAELNSAIEPNLALAESQEVTNLSTEAGESNEVDLNIKQAGFKKLNVQLQQKANTLASNIHSFTNENEGVLAAISKNKEEAFLFRSDKVVVNVAGIYAQSKSDNDSNNDRIKNSSVYALADFENEIDNGVTLVKVNDEYGNTRFDSDGSHIGYKGFWFGPNISFESRSLAKYHFMGNGLGLDFGFDLSSKFGIQTGARFNMLLKDFKLFDTDGKEYHELVDFSNVAIPLSLKFKKSYFAAKIERPVSFNTYLGMDYSRMLKIDKNTLGAHLGMEYDIFLRPAMMMTLGARGGISSIMNYSPSQSYLQENYKRVNYNFGVYAALRFVSSKR
jgi:hypothetical protein